MKISPATREGTLRKKRNFPKRTKCRLKLRNKASSFRPEKFLFFSAGTVAGTFSFWVLFFYCVY